jgi:hypothetical protein
VHTARTFSEIQTSYENLRTCSVFYVHFRVSQLWALKIRTELELRNIRSVRPSYLWRHRIKAVSKKHVSRKQFHQSITPFWIQYELVIFVIINHYLFVSFNRFRKSTQYTYRLIIFRFLCSLTIGISIASKCLYGTQKCFLLKIIFLFFWFILLFRFLLAFNFLIII